MDTSRLHLRFDLPHAPVGAAGVRRGRALGHGSVGTRVGPAWLLLAAVTVAVALLMLAAWLSDPGSARLA
ncbi:MAG: hypothetical protein HS128_01815 [Ideonella sp.]|nr:hypothetical protein [Ideonella sp.]